MLSHDQMAFAITKLYPDLVLGRDFHVAHPAAFNSDEQTGEAEIKVWPEGLEQPDRKTLRKTFNVHAEEFSARMTRLERDVKLKRSDWTQMPDIEEEKRKAWAKYRQTLRDLPQQAAFPNRIVWPKPPVSNT